MGEQQFKLYYRCYFNKYYQLPSNQSSTNREVFVSSLLAEAVSEAEEAPSENCVVWMCAEDLVWLHYHHQANSALEVPRPPLDT